MFTIPDPNDHLINDFTNKTVLFLEAKPHWGLHEVNDFEKAMNRREFYAKSDLRYRVLPYGVKMTNPPLPEVFLQKVIVKCVYCGQFGARMTECRHCGVPIG